MHYIPGAVDKRVLVACETSGTVRESFNRLGFNAFSCDLLPADDTTNKHFQCDVRDILEDDWDLLIVAHPPCTRLCNSGVRWLHVPPPNKTKEEMWQELDEGAELFNSLWNAPSKHVAVENPVMHKYAKERIDNYVKPQIVQPWWFGEPAFKATGFHLRNLPELIPTDKLDPPNKKDEPERHKAWSFIHMAAPSKDRWKLRSKTFDGIAAAMAWQWGNYILQDN